MRISSILLVSLAVLGLSTTARAQDDETPLKVAVVLVPQGFEGDGLTEQTLVSMGIRRGLRGNDRLDDEHPADVLIPELPDGVYEAREQEPDMIAELIQSGQAREAEERARATLEVYEDNLSFIKRRTLADVYTLLGVAQCLQRRRNECEDTFRAVVVFREHFYYDTERYPAQFEDTFSNVQMELVDSGARGSIEVVTEPEGAEVFVDGRSYGASPAVVEGLLVGDHYITVKAIGYEKEITRAAVEESYQGTVDVPLEQSENSLLITQAMTGIPAELGQQRAGDAIDSLRTPLFVDQAVVGTITPAGEGRANVHLYLYDLRTKFLLAEQEGEVTLDAEGSAQAQELVVALYEGVDLSGQIEAPDEGPNFEGTGSVLTKWWFWTGIGAAVIAVIVIAAVVASSGTEQLQEGWYLGTGSIESP